MSESQRGAQRAYIPRCKTLVMYLSVYTTFPTHIGGIHSVGCTLVTLEGLSSRVIDHFIMSNPQPKLHLYLSGKPF